MRWTLICFGLALSAGMLAYGADDKKPVSEQSTEAVAKPESLATEKQIVEREPTPDELAIRQADDSFVKAYGQGNAKAVAAHFAVDAEYVDELGNVHQGRDAIERAMAEFFSENPGIKLEMNIDTVRFISPIVAVADGSTTIVRTDSPEPIDSRYTAVYVKSDGNWLAGSIRDQAPKDRKQHREQLQQLDWLKGNWVDEGDDSIVNFSCEAVDSGNFLVREFTILIAGQQAMSGTQRIGWDPVTGKLRAWIFDSEGAYGEGLWHRDGDTWVLKTTGVTADGQTASGTSIYTFVNAHTMTWQSIDHEIGGVKQPDSEVYTIVRQAPAPMIVSEKSN